MLRQVFQYDPVIGYRFIPGLKARIPHEGGGYLIRVNDAGFRCKHEFRASRTPGYRRILLFGDSLTAGDGVSNEYRFGDLLEKAIPDLEIYNLGLSGTGTDQQFLAYKEYSMSIDHDVLIIALFVSNIRRVAAHARYYYDENGKVVCYEKPYYELVNGDLLLKNVPPRKEPIIESALSKEERNFIDRGHPVPGMIRKLISVTRQSSILYNIFIASGIKDLAQKTLHYQIVPEYDDPNNPAWLLMRAILKEWIINHKQPVLLIPIPFYHHVMGICDAKPYQSRMHEVASDAGGILYDPLRDFIKYPRKERSSFYFETDSHLTPKGHGAIATPLTPVIEKLLERS